MKQRMELLLATNVINQDSYQGIQLAVDLLQKNWLLDPANEQFQMAMTHLARASMRIKSAEPVLEGLDADILSEITEDEDFSVIEEMNRQICQVMQLENVPATENSFFLSNLYSMYCAKP